MILYNASILASWNWPETRLGGFATRPSFPTRRPHPVQDILGKFGPFSFRRLSYTEAQKILARVDSEAKDDA
jgi:hypothetical protein